VLFFQEMADDHSIYCSSLADVLGQKRGVISVTGTASIEEALEIMNANKIHSIAVRNGDEYRGILNRIDLLTPIAFAPKLGAAPDFKVASKDNLSITVQNLLGLTKESKKLHQLQTVDLLPDLLNVFSSGVHSVLVLDSSGKTSSIFTQSDVLTFLWQNKAKLGKWAHSATVGDMLVTVPVHTLDSNFTALAAFRDLLLNELKAAPVVDAEGKVVATLSLSDVAGLDRHNLGFLMQPIPEYIKGLRGKIPPTIGCEKKDSLLSVLEKITKTGIHQLWLLEDGKAKGAITLTNIIMTFFLQPDMGHHYFSKHKAYQLYYAQNPKVKDEFKVLDTPLSVLIKDKSAAKTIPQAESQKQALELMAKHKVLSLPVLNEEGKASGFVSCLDVLTAFAFSPKFAKDSQVDVKVLEEVLTRQLMLPVGHLLGATPESSHFPFVEEKDRLISLLPTLCQGIHRVYVQNPEAKNGIVVSQTDVIRFFLQNLASLGSVSALTVEKAVDVKNKRLVTVERKTTTLGAFREMLINDVSAVPVVDSKGQLVGSLSSTDIRGMTHSNVKDLLLPVEEFIKSRCGGEIPEPIVCSPEDTLETVIKALVNKKVHRVWVTKETKPVGVISMSDVIGAVYLNKVQQA